MDRNVVLLRFDFTYTSGNDFFEYLLCLYAKNLNFSLEKSQEIITLKVQGNEKAINEFCTSLENMPNSVFVRDFKVQALENESIEQKVKANETAKAQTQSSLRAEYKAFIQKSKRDKSLGEPRYSVYVLNSKKLNTKERAVINNITSTLSRRGGYLRYSLFVDKNSDERIKIYLFNEKLLGNKKWLTKKLSLPNLWFKFNQSSVQSIKNSFHIKEFKRFNLGVKIKSLNLSGHTDEIGGEFYNSMLGLQRSAAVASEFLRQTGKITLQTYGKDKPLSKGLKEKERYQNRRVEVKFE